LDESERGWGWKGVNRGAGKLLDMGKWEKDGKEKGLWILKSQI